VDAVAAGAEAELVLGVGNGALLDLAKAWPKGQL
jgi:glycerol dehydrogenase-like iron-containing ADH family enzyme